MATELEPVERAAGKPELADDFSARLESSLSLADNERRRRERGSRLAGMLLILLLLGPVIIWKLTSATTGSEHVAVDALVSLTLVLDVGLNVDTAVLSYLHLQALPFIVGTLLLLLAGAWLLWEEENEA